MAGFITDLPAAASVLGAELVEVAKRSPTVTMTATTISAAASDNSFNDSADGFIATGFAEGDRVGSEGFTGDTANNIFVGTIETLTASKMIIASPEGDVLIDDAEGESVTIWKWESNRLTLQEVVDLVGSSAYDFGFNFEATPGADALLGRVQIGRDITLPADFSGASGTGDVNPDATYEIDVLDDGASIGTISIADTGTITWTTDGGTEKSVAEGSQITFIGQTTPDASIAGWSFVLKATQD